MSDKKCPSCGSEKVSCSVYGDTEHWGCRSCHFHWRVYRGHPYVKVNFVSTRGKWRSGSPADWFGRRQ